MCQEIVDWCGRPECSREFELKDRRDKGDRRGEPGHDLNVVQVDQPGKNLCQRCVLEDDLVEACTKLEEDLREKGGLRPLSPVPGYEWSDSESGSSSSGLSSPPRGSEAGDDEGQDGHGGAGNGGAGDDSSTTNVASSPRPRIIVRDIYTSDSDSVWWEAEESSEYSESEQSVDGEELDEEVDEEAGHGEVDQEVADGGVESAGLGKRKREESDGSTSCSGESNEEGKPQNPKRARHQ